MPDSDGTSPGACERRAGAPSARCPIPQSTPASRPLDRSSWRPSPPLPLEALTQPDARPVQEHPYMSDGLRQNLTDLGTRELLNLPELEYLTLERRQAVQAVLDRVRAFSCAQR